MTDAPCFPGLGPAAFAWLDGLAADNSRAFFAAHRDTYDSELRQPVAALLAEASARHGGHPRLLRQLRDLRFAANRERPYWPTVAGELTGLAGTCVALGVDVGPDGLTALAGCRRFTSDQLARFRAAAADGAAGARLQEISTAIEASGMTLHGSTLRGTPRGIARDHPRAALLRHTGLSASRVLAPRMRRRGAAPGPAISRQAALDHLDGTWAELAQLTAWIDAFVGPAGGEPLAAAA